MDFDPDTMFSLLKVSEEKIRDKMIESAKERVTSIKREVGRRLPFSHIYNNLREGFQKILNSEFIEGQLSEYEEELTNTLRAEKYSPKEWVFKKYSLHLDLA